MIWGMVALTIKKWAVVLILLLASTCWGIPVLNHDTLDGFEPNEHIDWTSDNITYDIHNSNIDWVTASALIDHGLLLGLSDDDHTQYHNDSRAATWLDLASTTKTALWDTAYGWGDHASGGYQAQGDILDDLNTLGAPTADGEFLVATGAGAFAYETGDTAIASLGITATAAELNVLDGVTPGTVAASKAVVVDANKDIGTFRHITATGTGTFGSTVNAVHTTGSASFRVRRKDNIILADDVLGSYKFTGDDFSGTYNIGAEIRGVADDDWGTPADMPSRMEFYTDGTLRLTIDDTGISGLDASTTSKGVAKFDPTNFEVTDGEAFLKVDYTLSDDVLDNNAAEQSTASSTYVKLKETQIDYGIGSNKTIRIKFDLKRLAAGTPPAVAQIRRNGVAVGTTQTSTINTYATKSEDISGWSNGDLVQVYGLIAAGSTTYVRNLNICGAIVLVAENTSFAQQDP